MAFQVKLRLLFSDRLGIVADVARVLAAQGWNIVSMEVEKQGPRAVVYAEARQAAADGGSRRELVEALESTPGLVEIALVAHLPQELREGRFRVVLDSISDGILAVDADGKVTVINRVAKEILGCRARDVLGRKVEELPLPGPSVRRCLEGESFANERRSVTAGKGRVRFLASGRPIRSADGRILGAVEILKDMEEIRELAHAVSEPAPISFGDMIGKSPAIRQAIAFAQKIAPTDAIVSLRGESGTGKELFAAAIHTESGRKGPFLPVNCAALPEALLESELFGYVGGAFSGAKREGQAGLFEQARDGTLFLDEIGELPLRLQAKMLRAIQEGKVRRVGATGEVAVNTRVVTATNQNLERLVEENRFREDLFYRINVFPIHIPPLRERREDIPLLAEHFLFQLGSRLGKPIPSLAPEARDKLLDHRWPGNVRELRNVIERAAILCPTETIGPDCVLFSFELGREAAGRSGPWAPRPEPDGAASLPALLDRYEREIVAGALRRAPSKRQAARLLGISHTALLNKVRKHGL